MAHIYTDITELNDYLSNIQEMLNMDQYDGEIIIDYMDEDEEAGGECTGDVDHVDILLNPSMGLEETMVVLAHEMVHAAQILAGRLLQGHNVMFFDGQRVDTIDYHKRPHEIEAYLLEQHIYEGCK